MSEQRIFIPRIEEYAPVQSCGTGPDTNTDSGFSWCSAMQADGPVYANQLAAGRALPTDIFIPDELPDPVLLDAHQVFDHAHAVFIPVPFIEIFQTRAGEGRAGSRTVFSFALFAEAQGAFPAAFRIGSQAAVTPVLLTNISEAEPAVHSAWSYVRQFGLCCYHVVSRFY